ncbi:ABC transporter permease [Paenibacillus xylaniclasticus]|uniref:ABC transporter permease n=1 Tax=Paenibacillus xylaniclasticus TaxID=588083 RepID=UPI000FD74E9B|nr:MULTISPECIES: ABC transporter permease [Paenibacillus]GFN29963.1 sodium export permease [Paenibacillus curdlanolyticus]
MKPFLTVFQFHLKESYRSKAFKIMAVVMFLLVVGVFVAAHYMSDDSKLNLKLLSESSEYKLDIDGINEQSDIVELTAIDSGELEASKEEVKNGDIDGVVVIGESNGMPTIAYTYSQFPDLDALAVIKNELNMQYIVHVTEEKNIAADAAQALLAQIEIQEESLNRTDAMGLVYFFSFLMYLFIMMYGQMVGLSIAGEKVSRVMEVMITKVKPTTMMYAKVLSSMVAGLTQIAIIAAGYLTAREMGWVGEQMTVFGLPIDISIVTVKLFVFLVVYFILGYSLYAIMYAALASMVSRIEDMNSVTAPLYVLLMVAFFLSVKCMADPSSFTVVVASYIPMFSPMVTFSRMVMGEAGALELVITIAEIAVTIGILSFFTNRLYASGVMRYAEKTKFSDIIKLTREA